MERLTLGAIKAEQLSECRTYFRNLEVLSLLLIHHSKLRNVKCRVLVSQPANASFLNKMLDFSRYMLRIYSFSYISQFQNVFNVEHNDICYLKCPFIH